MRESIEPVSLVSASLQDLVRETLTRIGENPDRDGLLRTPERFEHSLQYLTEAYGDDAKEVLLDAMVDVAYDEMVIIKDIEVFSLCEHHVLPFFGKAHVGYIPRGKVIGLSKVPRMVDVFARHPASTRTPDNANCRGHSGSH